MLQTCLYFSEIIFILGSGNSLCPTRSISQYQLCLHVYKQIHPGTVNDTFCYFPLWKVRLRSSRTSSTKERSPNEGSAFYIYDPHLNVEVGGKIWLRTLPPSRTALTQSSHLPELQVSLWVAQSLFSPNFLQPLLELPPAPPVIHTMQIFLAS